MKTLFLTRTLNPGGAERQLVNLAISLKQRGHNVSVATFYYSSETFLKQELLKNQVVVHCLNKKSRWDLLFFLPGLIQLVKKTNPEIIHSYLGVPNCLTILLKPFFRHIKMIWGVRASFLDLSQYDWIARTIYKIECYLSRFADLIIVNSFAGLDYAVLNGFSEKNMVVIPNGIDTDKFYPHPEIRSIKRKALGIKDNQFVVGIVARIDPMKDYPNFLYGLKKAIEQQPTIVGVCIGEGPEKQKNELIHLVHEMGIEDKVKWLGGRDDISDLMNIFDLNVSSSYGEGFSNTIAEAMSCGVSCVVTDVGDSGRIVGNCGSVVEPKNSDLLSKGISEMCQRPKDERERLSIQARERIVNNFDLEKMIQSTEHYMKQVVSNKAQ